MPLEQLYYFLHDVTDHSRACHALAFFILEVFLRFKKKKTTDALISWTCWDRKLFGNAAPLRVYSKRHWWTFGGFNTSRGSSYTGRLVWTQTNLAMESWTSELHNFCFPLHNESDIHLHSPTVLRTDCVVVLQYIKHFENPAAQVSERR